MLCDQAIDIPSELSSEDVTVSLLDERVRFSLRVKRKDLATFKKISGLKLPLKIGQSASTKNKLCFCLGPDEWLLVASVSKRDELTNKLKDVSSALTCSITDISHRNVGFDISGSKAATLINVGCPQDLSRETFPVGKVTRTVFESASIILYRKNETAFQIECWRSFGPYMRDFFKRVLTT